MTDQKRSKAKKMPWADFLKDEKFGGSWADEELDMPTAPASVAYGQSREAARPIGYSGDNNSRGPQRGGFRSGGYRPNKFHAPREPSRPIPSSPPFVAFVGQLAPETEESHLRDIFGDLGIESIRFVMNYDGLSHRGFCYMQLESPEALEEALKRHGTSLFSKYIKVDVAEPETLQKLDRQRSGRPQREPVSYGNWRRHTPRDDESVEHAEKPAPTFALGANFVPNGKREGVSTDERPKLNLTPRSQPVESSSSSTSKSNPFGSAKPVDVREHDKSIEEKLNKQRASALAEAEPPKKPKHNPFGSAKPVDVRGREKEIEEKLAKKIESLKVDEDDNNDEPSSDTPKTPTSQHHNNQQYPNKFSYGRGRYNDDASGESRTKSFSRDSKVRGSRFSSSAAGDAASDWKESSGANTRRKEDGPKRYQSGAKNERRTNDRNKRDNSQWAKSKAPKNGSEGKGAEDKAEPVASKNAFDVLDHE